MAALLVAVAVGLPAVPASAGDRLPLTIRARSLDVSRSGPGREGYIEIGIERWSTGEERTRLRAVLAQEGTDGLLAELYRLRPRAGYVRSPGAVGWTARFAHQQPTADGGRRILVATERPVPHRERLNPTPITRYPFTLVEIELDRQGKGRGRLIPAARLSWNQGQGAFDVDAYHIEPVRLTDVNIGGLP